MHIAFETNVGRRRTSNQDTIGVYKNQSDTVIGIVADGMGGHLAGDTASRLLVTGLGTSWETSNVQTKEEVAKWLTEKIQTENERIFNEGNNHPEKFGMGTTIVAAVVLLESVLIAHVGDSRGYIIRDNSIKQLTSDHSLVNELVKKGEITPEMADTHPKKNVLIRSIGVPGVVEVDLSIVTIEENDYILLCSDGLSNMLSDQEIKDIILQEEPLQEKVIQLIDAANIAGGRDNISVLLIDFLSATKVGEEV